ncbi:hypothetical protein [Neisseria zoodegmatis]|uniref:Integral membrane protein n=2 Tax=Neisseria zoodegmatis TaxID=326523 RepID=A0AB38DNK8_9NEIS|nr:hypothetical protein [Neisseria zoodegmatis]SNU78932.1 Uncharacterised protein [Neisseria zoodegmatis]
MEMYVITALVFVHFILAAAVLMRVLYTDFLLLKNYHAPLGHSLIKYTCQTQKAARIALAGLIATGVIFVVHGAASNPEYMNNPKLWVKFLCVAALVTNEFWLHRLSRHISHNTTLSGLPYALSIQLSISGAIRSASWFFTCWLGIARSWNKVMLFEDVLAHYGMVLLAAVCLSMAVNIRFNQSQSRHYSE